MDPKEELKSIQALEELTKQASRIADALEDICQFIPMIQGDLGGLSRTPDAILQKKILQRKRPRTP